MIDLCKQQNLTDETIASLKNLQIMWEEQFEKILYHLFFQSSI